MKITWRDHAVGGVRKVEYFPQGYIIDIASSPVEISKIVYKIIQSDEELNTDYETLQQDIKDVKKLLSEKVETFFSTLDDLSRARTILRDLGNKEGIKKEIEKIQDSINQIREAYPEKLTEEQEAHYKKCVSDIDALNAKIKAEKEAKKKQQVVEVKSLRLPPNIDTGDINTKLKQTRKWIESGMKVKIDMRFRGRMMTRSDVGKAVMEDFVEQLADVSTIEKKPALEGNTMSCVLAPKKNK